MPDAHFPFVLQVQLYWTQVWEGGHRTLRRGFREVSRRSNAKNILSLFSLTAPMTCSWTGTGLVRPLWPSSCPHWCFFKEDGKSWDVQWWTTKGELYLGPSTRYVWSVGLCTSAQVGAACLHMLTAAYSSVGKHHPGVQPQRALPESQETQQGPRCEGRRLSARRGQQRAPRWHRRPGAAHRKQEGPVRWWGRSFPPSVARPYIIAQVQNIMEWSSTTARCHVCIECVLLQIQRSWTTFPWSDCVRCSVWMQLHKRSNKDLGTIYYRP